MRGVHRLALAIVIVSVMALLPTVGAVSAASSTTGSTVPDPIVVPEQESLAKAVAAAEPGSTIIVEGAHAEPEILVDKPLTIQGAESTGAGVVAEARGTLFRVVANDVTIIGLSLTGTGQPGDAGVVVDAQGATVENTRLENLNITAVDTGIRLVDTVGASLTGNSISVFASDVSRGIEAWAGSDGLSPSANLTISGNEIIGSSGSQDTVGIYVGSPVPALWSDIRLYQNSISFMAFAAVQVESSAPGSTIELWANELLDTTHAGLEVKGASGVYLGGQDEENQNFILGNGIGIEGLEQAELIGRNLFEWNGAAPCLEIVNGPTASTVVAPGDTLQITWETDQPGPCDLLFMDDQSVILSPSQYGLPVDSPGVGSYTWQVPADFYYSGPMLIQVRTVIGDQSLVIAESPLFTSVGAPPPLSFSFDGTPLGNISPAPAENYAYVRATLANNTSSPVSDIKTSMVISALNLAQTAAQTLTTADVEVWTRDLAGNWVEIPVTETGDGRLLMPYGPPMGFFVPGSGSQPAEFYVLYREPGAYTLTFQAQSQSDPSLSAQGEFGMSIWGFVLTPDVPSQIVAESAVPMSVLLENWGDLGLDDTLVRLELQPAAGEPPVQPGDVTIRVNGAEVPATASSFSDGVFAIISPSQGFSTQPPYQPGTFPVEVTFHRTGSFAAYFSVTRGAWLDSGPYLGPSFSPVWVELPIN